jgi:hypothetical protein
MTTTFDITVATEALAERMASRLRLADEAEVLAAYNFTPLEALRRSIRASRAPRAWLVDGEPGAMWGVEPVAVGARIGIAWLLGTEEIDRHPLVFWRLCKDELRRMLAEWRVLLNYIDAHYEKSLRWARGLGFQVDAPRPFGALGAPFCTAAIIGPEGGW